MYSDAHLHFDEQLCNIWKNTRVTSIISCTSVIECEQARKLCEQFPFLKMSCGIHPWHADKINWDDMINFMDTCDIIGEIGMDDVWCEVPLDIQKDIFIKQIQYANKHHKPVILHTKGQELQIAEIIKQYPNTYLVHWYSCMDYLEIYKEMNCYFSVGPDLQDSDVQQVVKEIRLDHLLIESDGISAIAWAKKQDITDVNYLQTLDDTANYIAKQKQISVSDTWNHINKNLSSFLNGK